MSILGTRVVRTEDPLFLTRGATYTDDLVDDRLTGAVHVTFVRSQVAHGRILSVDAEDARTAGSCRSTRRTRARRPASSPSTPPTTSTWIRSPPACRWSRRP